LAIITGEPDVNKLRARLTAGYEESGANRWHDLAFHFGSLLELMNLSKLDTLK